MCGFPRLAEAIRDVTPEEEDGIVSSLRMHRSGAARTLATSVHLRYDTISEHHRRFVQAQKKDTRARFISGLVTAYRHEEVRSDGKFG